MAPERWLQVERIYHEAAARRLEERPSFLDQECAGDDGLRAEVERMLAVDEGSGGFLNRSAVHGLPGLLALAEPLSRGCHLGPYEIISLLGTGGMGEVYKARDPRLNRTVAIKVLPSHVAADPHRRKRFLREARAASALDHPNIVAVHDIVSEGGRDGLVMDYVDGETLEAWLRRKRLSINEALGYAEQIADALLAAHAAGIVHRDIKPSNIMVTEDGRVKVLDFGLAKQRAATADAMHTPLRTALTEASALSQAGIIVGTLAYMSPEQAKAQEADARSDIFSFGTVLYEMITGQPAFHRESRIETVAAVLNQDPKPADEIVPRLPEELGKILRDCLQKDPVRRFQHMGDVTRLLEDVKEGARRGVPSLSTDPVIAPIRRRPFVLLASAAAVLLVGSAIWRVGVSSSGERGPILRRLTFDRGLTTTPAISADGKLLAFASDRAGHGNLDIWVGQLAGGDPMQITHDPADEYEPAFNPDGTIIAFRSRRDGGEGIYVISTLGVDEPRMIAPMGRRPMFSPDGKRIVYWVGEEQGPGRPMRSQVFIASASGGERRQLAPELAAAYAPVWSSDGRYILFAGSPVAHIGVDPDWYIAPTDGGNATSTGAASIFERLRLSSPIPAAWTQENKIVFSASLADSTNLWEIPVRPGSGRLSEPARRLTFGTGAEGNAALVVGSRPPSLVFSVLQQSSDIWSIPLDSGDPKLTNELHRFTHDGAAGKAPSISTDGRYMVFSSNRSGAYRIYGRHLIDGKETPFSNGPGKDARPVISPDGSHLAYFSVGSQDNKAGKYVLLRFGTNDGQLPVPLKPVEGFGQPYSWSWNNENLFYAVKADNRWTVEMLNVRSNRNYPVFRPGRYETFYGKPSPDNQWLLFLTDIDGKHRVHAAPFREGTMLGPEDWFVLTNSATFEDKPSWSPDGTRVYYTSDRDGFRCIWAQRLDAKTKRPIGPQIPVYHSHSALLSLRNLPGVDLDIAVARDKLVFNMAETTGNLWQAQLSDR
jgi:serine/threonine protein kinase/Tol biopolymer transport system component